MKQFSPWVAASVVLNVALLTTVLSMGVPMLARIQEQRASGYVPPLYGMPEFGVLVASPFVVAGLIGLGLLLWPFRRRWWLVLADAIAVAAAWTVFVPYVFVNDAPLAAIPLSITALIVTAVTIHRQRGHRLQSEVRTTATLAATPTEDR
jgi:hypothetical protein